MNRTIVAAVALLAGTAVFAQTAASAPAEDQKIVAVVNGEVITRAKLDALYDNMSVQVRAKYERSGGKTAFLDSYVSQRLLIQEAIKSGFDQRPAVQAALDAAKESALLDRYVRDVIAAPIVTDGAMRTYYDEHKADFAVPESIKVRHIVISWNQRPKPDALELIKRIATEIRAGAPSPRDGSPQMKGLLLNRFSAAARQYSEDGVAQSGGDLGWVTRGSLDNRFEEAAFSMPPMTMSGIVESQFGYHLIYAEAAKPAGTQPFADVKADIREFLISQHSAEVVGSVKRLTSEVRASSKVAFYPENVK